MTLGQTIKSLRRRANMTQESLAELLSLSPQAVSRWENDAAMPDLSQVPSLCHIFKISSDDLLGINLENNEEEIKRILSEANTLGNQGKQEERTQLLREANQKYPRDHQIMHRLAVSLICEYSRKGIMDYDEVFRLCKRILAECTDSQTRYETIETLCIAYDYAGKKEEMLKLAKEMPRAEISYESFMMYHWEGDAGFREFRNYMSFLITEICQMLSIAGGQRHDNNDSVYSLDDSIKLWETEVSLLDLLFPDGDYQTYALLGESACCLLCDAYLKKHDADKTWKWIEKRADFAVYADNYDFDSPHTSPVLRNYSSGGWIMPPWGNHTQIFLDWLTADESTAVLRDDKRYNNLVHRLHKTAKKP